MRIRRALAIAVALAACGGGAVTTTTDVATSGTATTTTSGTTDATTTTSVTTTTTTIPPRPRLPRLPDLAEDETVCSLYGAPVEVGKVTDLRLLEVSGIAASRRHTGVIWALNDSGDDPNLYAVADGDTISTITLDGVFPVDWEDLDLGPGPGGLDHLYVGDVGDNLRFRPWISVFRLPEPDPDLGVTQSTSAVEIELVYPEGEPVDAEAIAIDPVTGDLFVIPKSREEVGVYRATAADLVSGERITLERIASLDVGSEVTAAAFSADGDRLVLRGYRTMWIWLRTDLDIARVIETDPCRPETLRERQGEAVTLLDDDTIVTISEGGRPPINAVPPRS